MFAASLMEKRDKKTNTLSNCLMLHVIKSLVFYMLTLLTH